MGGSYSFHRKDPWGGMNLLGLFLIPFNENEYLVVDSQRENQSFQGKRWAFLRVTENGKILMNRSVMLVDRACRVP